MLYLTEAQKILVPLFAIQSTNSTASLQINGINTFQHEMEFFTVMYAFKTFPLQKSL